MACSLPIFVVFMKLTTVASFGLEQNTVNSGATSCNIHGDIIDNRGSLTPIVLMQSLVSW